MTTKRGGALLALALACSASCVHASPRRRRRRSRPPSPSWCGPKKIKLGLTDGFGGNSWRLVTTASARDEAKKCPSVTSIDYADGQGNTQKAISDIQGMVAKGVNALVVFPDAGKAILPALRSAVQGRRRDGALPRRPRAARPASTTTSSSTRRFAQAGENWGKWILKVLPKGGNVLMLSGPKGNSQGIEENQGLHKILDPTHKYKFIGEQPFEVTNWDPALTQKVLSAAIAKYPKIDVIVSDFGPSLVGALPEFKKSGRTIPALATSDGNVLGCFWKTNEGQEPDVQAVHRLDAERPRPPRDRLGRGARHRRQEAGDDALPVARCSRTRSTGKPQPGGVQAEPAGRHLPLRRAAGRRAGQAGEEVGRTTRLRAAVAGRRAHRSRPETPHRGQRTHRQPAAPSTSRADAQPTLSLRGITKHYDGVAALPTSRSRCCRARCTPCSARTAPASRR